MSDNDKNIWLRNIPSVGEMLQRPRVSEAFGEKAPRFMMIRAIQETLDALRSNALKSQSGPQEGWMDDLETKIIHRFEELLNHRLQRVINATGIVLHTNMGRALLPPAAVAAVAEAAAAYTNLELDLATGKRGLRYAHVEELLCRLTGAESALVVNNNAAAVLLALNTLGQGREAIVSRGQLVEIGGSFRVPEVMAQSGVKLVEVGTTNRTKLKDYEQAIGADTGMIVRVHTSNYRIVGFVQDVPLKDLVTLGRAHSVPVMDDLGSGCLVPLDQWHLPVEPTVQESIAAGADVITFSADKLLGGPQAGIILGKDVYLAPMKKSPLLRALRLDKLTLAALEALLYIYLESSHIQEDIPVLRMLTEDLEDIHHRAASLAMAIQQLWRGAGQTEVVASEIHAGGGSLPEAAIPSAAVALSYADWSANRLENYLRSCRPAVMSRIYQNRVLLEVRTLLQHDTDDILTALDPVRMNGGPI